MRSLFVVKKKGFTLIEIIIVLLIISIVVVLGVTSYSYVRKKVKLDIAANTIHSIIVEARDKTRSGYFEADGDISEAKSICFGFRLTNGGFIKLLSTKYDRLELYEKCSRLKQDFKELRTAEEDPSIIIKGIEEFGKKVSDEAIYFFRPPHADIDLKTIRSDRDPVVRIVIGFADSDEPLDKREVIFNVLTGNVYSKRFEEKIEEPSIFEPPPTLELEEPPSLEMERPPSLEIE